MADFLSRLVERSAGTAPVARPVVAPLFAAGPAMAANPVPDGSEPAGAVPQEPTPLTPQEPKALTSIPREPTGIDTPGDRPARAPARPAAANPEEIPLGVLRPAAEAFPEGPRPAVLDEDGGSQGEGLPVTAPPLRRLPVSRDRSHGEVRIPVLTTPRLRPRDEGVSRWAEPPGPRGVADESSAPIVRISIGRIEVRAVTPPAPAAPRPAPARKSMGPSLEEYLRPRSRGR